MDGGGWGWLGVVGWKDYSKNKTKLLVEVEAELGNLKLTKFIKNEMD